MANGGATQVLIAAVPVRLSVCATLSCNLKHEATQRFISCLYVRVRVCTLQWTMLFIFVHGNMANVKIGVPENYNGIFPWYLAKVRLFNDHFTLCLNLNVPLFFSFKTVVTMTVCVFFSQYYDHVFLILDSRIRVNLICTLRYTHKTTFHVSNLEDLLAALPAC